MKTEDVKMKSKPPAIDEINTEVCTGCFGCYNSCPYSAVSMVLSGDGFYLPSIDRKLCTNCGICQNHCPIISNNESNNRNADNIKVYASWSNSHATRLKSSSGGVFSEIARWVLNDSGVVIGVEWNDDFSSVRHVQIADEKDLAGLQGSKYMQSNVGDIYKTVVRLTENNKKVLFTGLPCQVAALNLFVQSPNLLTVDLVCHGTPSINVYRKYLSYIAEGRQAKGVNFRHKEPRWTKFSVKVDFSDGSEYSCIYRDDSFFIGFLNNLYINTPCYKCSHCSMPRAGDITLADYWGVPAHLKDDKGVSLVLSNNDKGDRVLEDLVRDKRIQCIESDLSIALKGNPRLTEGALELPGERERFFNDLDILDFDELREKYIHSLNISDK